MVNPSHATSLTGDHLRGMLTAGCGVLADNMEAINALNVFPVPDGDTGTNMVLTLRVVVEHAEGCADPAIGAVGTAVARGALVGARGNSGVILSQFLRAFCRALDGCDEADAPALTRAVLEGSAAAYRAVSKPVEGTMLTVMRAAAVDIQAAHESGEMDVARLLERGLEGCREAVARTPEQLPVLRHAGVVDAGGQGFALLLEGAVRFLRGDGTADIHLPVSDVLGRVREGFLAEAEAMEYGYCTQFLIEGEALDPDDLRERFGAAADSAVVMGDGQMVGVHAHTPDPDSLVALGRSLGTVSQVNVESIDDQHQEFQAAHRAARPPTPVGVVAVCPGSGLAALFRGLGVGVVVLGGQTMNPSCQDLLEAIEALPAEAALLLPNNPNIVAVAYQAAGLAGKPVLVVPTRSIPQGVSAALAFSPEAAPRDNEAAMSRAASEVRSGEVVTAVRDAVLDGTAVRAGQCMGLLEDAPATVADSSGDALTGLVEKAAPGPGSLVTLYWGGDVSEAQAEGVAQRLRTAHPGVETEVVSGGQPHYHYLVAIE